MDALIRFTKKGKFENIEDVKKYFMEEISQQNNNYFYNATKISQIKKDDILYFSFGGEIVAITQFTGKYKKRKKSFSHGYKIKNIKILDNPIHINNKLFIGRAITYIKNDAQREELNKIEYSVNTKEEILIKSLEIDNFTLFKKNNLNFSKGINIFIGENGTGKSQILKLIYSIIKANNRDDIFKGTIVDEFKGVFRPTDKEIKNLISFGEKKSSIKVDLSAYPINFNFTENSQYKVNIENITSKFYKKEIIFIPAQEILSHFKGFIATYNKREIAFDKTVNDLALELELPLLKDQKLISEKNKELEEILQGEIVQLNGEFYLRRFKDEKLVVSSMMAEGLRKIGTISYLLKNGALNKDCILFWDEPESNINPKHIRAIAKLFIYLEKLGIQIFIATHSLFLIKEIEILRKKENQIKYFSFGFSENDNVRISQNEVFEYLDDLIILDEAIEQSDRFIREVD